MVFFIRIDIAWSGCSSADCMHTRGAIQIGFKLTDGGQSDDRRLYVGVLIISGLKAYIIIFNVLWKIESEKKNDWNETRH